MKDKFKGFIKKFLETVFKYLGYEISLKKIKINKSFDNSKINLNIAAGNYVISGFKSLDLYTEHYYKSKQEFLETRIEYDLRKDKIPYSDNSVSNIYISHAIEHVENDAVENFILESFRVLDKGGVLRIACPDSEFLYAVTQFENEYWKWRTPSLSRLERYTTDWSSCTQHDFLLRELSTPRMRFYNNRIKEKVMDHESVKALNYNNLVEKLKTGLQFREEHPGDHINNWDFDRLQVLGIKAGFKNIIRSKWRGSVSEVMSGDDFDKTAPQMSLYVEMIK